MMTIQDVSPTEAQPVPMPQEITEAMLILIEAQKINAPLALALVEALSVLTDDRANKDDPPTKAVQFNAELKKQIIELNSSISKAQWLLYFSATKNVQRVRQRTKKGVK